MERQLKMRQLHHHMQTLLSKICLISACSFYCFNMDTEGVLWVLFSEYSVSYILWSYLNRNCCVSRKVVKLNIIRKEHSQHFPQSLSRWQESDCSRHIKGKMFVILFSKRFLLFSVYSEQVGLIRGLSLPLEWVIQMDFCAYTFWINQQFHFDSLPLCLLFIKHSSKWLWVQSCAYPIPKLLAFF